MKKKYLFLLLSFFLSTSGCQASFFENFSFSRWNPISLFCGAFSFIRKRLPGVTWDTLYANEEKAKKDGTELVNNLEKRCMESLLKFREKILAAEKKREELEKKMKEDEEKGDKNSDIILKAVKSLKDSVEKLSEDVNADESLINDAIEQLNKDKIEAKNKSDEFGKKIDLLKKELKNDSNKLNNKFGEVADSIVTKFNGMKIQEINDHQQFMRLAGVSSKLLHHNYDCEETLD